MRHERGTPGRKWSAGTVFMLALLVVVLGGSVLVLGRLSSGASVDLKKLNMDVLNIREDPARAGTDEIEYEFQRLLAVAFSLIAFVYHKTPNKAAVPCKPVFIIQVIFRIKWDIISDHHEPNRF